LFSLSKDLEKLIRDKLESMSNTGSMMLHNNH